MYGLLLLSKDLWPFPGWELSTNDEGIRRQFFHLIFQQFVSSFWATQNELLAIRNKEEEFFFSNTYSHGSNKISQFLVLNKWKEEILVNWWKSRVIGELGRTDRLSNNLTYLKHLAFKAQSWLSKSIASSEIGTLTAASINYRINLQRMLGNYRCKTHKICLGLKIRRSPMF